MSSKTLTAEDLFECTQCGDCCRGYGGTHVTGADIQAIAEYLRIPAETVRHRYCVLSGDKRMLAQGDNGYCVFWDRVCTIHPVKPRMCRQWPFIASVLTDVTNWAIMADGCPGMRVDVDETAVLACVRAVMQQTKGHP